MSSSATNSALRPLVSNKSCFPSKAATPKRVTFSEYSSLSVYPVYPSHKKSYSKADYRLFRNRALVEAQQIRELIEASPLSAAETVHLLVKNELISSANFVGIEDLILESSVIQDRRVHSKLLLNMQNALKESNTTDPNLLAQVSTARSANSVTRARVKAAAMAA